MCIIMEKGSKSVFHFFLYTFGGLLVFVVFSHMRPLTDGLLDIFGRLLVAGFLLLLHFIPKGSTAKKAKSLPVAFLIALIAVSLDLYLPTSRWLVEAIGTSYSTPMGISVDKLDSSLIIIITVIILNKLTGGSLKDLRIQKGNLRKGLSVGIPAFIIAASLSPFLAGLFGASAISLENIIEWLPWIVIFITGNALNEELLFRGLFLGRIESHIGRNLANLTVTIPFVLHHTGVTYTNDSLMFLAYLIPLSLAWGRITQDSDRILGAVLFHAGTDITVALALFSNL